MDFTHSFIHPLIQQMFTELQLHSRFTARPWAFIANKISIFNESIYVFVLHLPNLGVLKK